MKVSNMLIAWYRENKRDLPWRHTRDPYIIWLSEIILQQTRVEQGMPYFYRFIETFPTIKDFAAAKESEILKLWEGLGYYSRARNMHMAAKEIQQVYSGKFPGDYEKLKKLKGIGDYTAAAIASFAFNLPYPVLDGNVYRFLSRYFGMQTPINSSKAKKEFLIVAGEIMEKKDPSIFNQAIMEFGALQCKPRNPECSTCIFGGSCYAVKNNQVLELPKKTRAKKPRERHFNYLFIRYKSKFFIHKRSIQDIWKHLYELPLIETQTAINASQLVKQPQYKLLSGNNKRVKLVTCFRHQLTHQTIRATFYELEIVNIIPAYLKKNFIQIETENLTQYAFPRLIQKFLEQVL